MKLHASDTVALVEVWTALKNYVPAKDQRQAAEQFIASLEDAGLVDFSIDNRDVYGVCEVFDAVLRTYCEEQGYTDEDEIWDE